MCISHNEACRRCVPEMELIQLSVNVNQETARALLKMMTSREDTATETVRRAIAVSNYFHKEYDAGRKIVITNPDGTNTRELVLP